jgi:hypothetical protein
MKDLDKPGLLYLGKVINTSTHKSETELLYDSKNLTTHAVCVGMTGSGKTGLGITILEEAGIDKIPAIIIDPKGDLGNLLLTFPNLSPEEFKPWVDNAEAERKGITQDAYAEYIAKTWKDGLAAWGEDLEKIKKFRNNVDLLIYTPASQAGIPISILSSFKAPSKEELLDPTIIRDKVLSITSSLLGLLGINADPLKSREQILISTLIQQAWQNGDDLDIVTLIRQVQKPPFTEIGALDIDTFYPEKDRLALSVSLNNLLASPAFQAWMEGVPLDIGQLLYSNHGKPKLSIISIAHLSDSERMFFVTLLLNEFISWMRRQPGTSSLQAILYMDEIFGFFPPISAPPSKLPMLTLLKQARAYGIGIILATQNPVDLDYKGLSNCGTWFIGKLQTERDKARVLEGLNIASNGEMDTQELDKMIALTGKRIFIMRSIYEKNPILFETRWTLSYLRGPLTLNQIALLKKTFQKFSDEKTTSVRVKEKQSLLSSKPKISSEIEEFFVDLSDGKKPVHYEPRLGGIAKIHFIDSKNKIDLWEEVCFIFRSGNNESGIEWENGKNIPDLKRQLKKEPVEGSTFDPLPPNLAKEKNYSLFAKEFAAYLYQNQIYNLYQTTSPPITSKQGESEKDFRIRAALAIREQRDELIKKVNEKYAAKIANLSSKVERSQEKADQKKQTAFWVRIQTGISFLFTILAAALGKKITQGTIRQTGTTLRRATKMGQDSQDVTTAEGEILANQQKLDDLEAQKNEEIASIVSQDADSIQVDTISIRPRKNDIVVDKMALIWLFQGNSAP